MLGGSVLIGCISSILAPLMYRCSGGPGTLDTSVLPIGGSVLLNFSSSAICATSPVMMVYDSIASGATLSIMVRTLRSEKPMLRSRT